MSRNTVELQHPAYSRNIVVRFQIETAPRVFPSRASFLHGARLFRILLNRLILLTQYSSGTPLGFYYPATIALEEGVLK